MDAALGSERAKAYPAIGSADIGPRLAASPGAAGRVWLDKLNVALASGDEQVLSTLWKDEGFWRDLLIFGWRFQIRQGAEEVAKALAREVRGVRFELVAEPVSGVMGPLGATVDMMLRFETPVATGRSFVRLLPDGGRHRAMVFLTAMEDLKAFPERSRRHVGSAVEAAELTVPERGLRNWADRREAIRSFSERDPDVVIVGAGMAGLMAAARLERLGISTLIVDRHPRVGDIWRNRYHSLTLHNQTCTNHFPYMPFPDTWPAYIPKDKLAGWMEYYAEAMELNVWSSTEFLGGKYSWPDGRWTVEVRQEDGSERLLRPSHVVMAVGLSGKPFLPNLEGIERFEGPVLHSSGPTGTLEVEGRKVIVIGSGNSAHDIAQDLYLRGAEVTMVQRSPIVVVSLEPSSIRVHDMFMRNEGLIPLADLDLMAAATPLRLMAQLQQPLDAQMAEDDRELLDALRSVGFMLDESGYFMKALTTQSGYYLNVGASDLIVQRKIALRSNVGVTRLAEHQVELSDGSALDADLVVLATGYQPLLESVRALFGDEVAERVGTVGGLDDAGEMRNLFGPTPQPGLHVVGGGLMGCRSYSHYLARLIKAEIEGIAPDRRKEAVV